MGLTSEEQGNIRKAIVDNVPDAVGLHEAVGHELPSVRFMVSQETIQNPAAVISKSEQLSSVVSAALLGISSDASGASVSMLCVSSSIAVYTCRGSISRIEDMQRTVTDIESYGLAEVLGVSVDELFDREK